MGAWLTSNLPLTWYGVGLFLPLLRRGKRVCTSSSRSMATCCRTTRATPCGCSRSSPTWCARSHTMTLVQAYIRTRPIILSPFLIRFSLVRFCLVPSLRLTLDRCSVLTTPFDCPWLRPTPSLIPHLPSLLGQPLCGPIHCCRFSLSPGPKFRLVPR